MDTRELKIEIVESLANRLGFENLEENLEQYFDVPLFEGDDENGEGFGLDSIDALEVVIAIKKDFDVKIGDDNLSVIKSVSSIANYIENEIKE